MESNIVLRQLEWKSLQAVTIVVSKVITVSLDREQRGPERRVVLQLRSSCRWSLPHKRCLASAPWQERSSIYLLYSTGSNSFKQNVKHKFNCTYPATRKIIHISNSGGREKNISQNIISWIWSNLASECHFESKPFLTCIGEPPISDSRKKLRFFPTPQFPPPPKNNFSF